MSGKKISRSNEGTERSWDLKDIQQLIDLLIQREVAEFEMEKDGMRIRILRRASGGTVLSMPTDAAQSIPAPSNNHLHATPAQADAPAASEPASEEPLEDHHVIKSPIVGTFYASPAPDAPPFVDLGDDVDVGQVLCIVEAMKLMNEIESEVAGQIVRIHVENGQPVEYGQPLFTVKPSEPK
ncbi:MAG: acetyl-CoA carboxylase biotin carboxyl carrier protein [Acidobacteria bacterium]|nr:acetyl-CoA carboxylase biotin carboxyl carrier protein [Acidobacteriota bacterium]